MNDAYLKRKYGITMADREKMLKDQNYKCALCGKLPKRFLCVEHNHRTGKVRSMACFYCNKYRIGRHDKASAKALYEYMKKYD